jgi:hypothetical protein
VFFDLKEFNTDLIKLDSEDTEHLVLRDAQEVLKNHNPIIMSEVINGQIVLENELKPHNYLF